MRGRIRSAASRATIPLMLFALSLDATQAMSVQPSRVRQIREAKRRLDAKYDNVHCSWARAEEAAERLPASASTEEAIRCEERLVTAESALQRAEQRRQQFERVERDIALQLRPVALALDIETCGYPPSIWQLAVVVANSNYTPTPSFEALVRPPASALRAKGKFALPKHVDLSTARPFAEVWHELEAWLDQNVQADLRRVVWAAHNGRTFDFPIIEKHLKAIDFKWRSNWHQHDTLEQASSLLSRSRAYGGRLKLGDLYKLATGGSELVNAHDALEDAAALVLVWRYLAERSECFGLASTPLLVEATKWRLPSGGISFAALQLSLSRHGKAEWELQKGYDPPELLEMDLTPGIRSETWRTAQLADGPEGTNVSYTNMGLRPLETTRVTNLQQLYGVGDMTERALREEGIRTIPELGDWFEREAGTNGDLATWEGRLSSTLQARGVCLPKEKVRGVVSQMAAGMQAQRDEQRELEQKLLEEQKLGLEALGFSRVIRVEAGMGEESIANALGL